MKHTSENRTNPSSTYRAGRAAVMALQEAEAAFSDIHVKRSILDRLLGFVCSKRGLSLLFVALAVGTHREQVQRFVNTHVLHSSKSAPADIDAAQGEDAEEFSDAEDKPRTSIAAPLRRAAKNKKAVMDHNANTVAAAEEILEDTE